ncbi:MAG: tRNA lysidine(34) synthetase TilS [Micrococcales bacterium 73-15]|uniref:tRNA lysidine(34) synthetase TilS n=1 Tax=Salana multivorans TaxID=120377 RepID=UPI0009592996|nr:tRNA lysidine(34) synthetase TilS [Salana multivorans]OJX97459.1 MAG: tRNA lysidine(34) synthetase TilS [Micrococcales bacterium 73-15]
MPRLDPDVARTRSAVRAWLDADPAHRDGLALVACSGGPDSLALAAALAFETRDGGTPAGAVVVDHGLQDGSAGVAQEAAARCRALGLDPVVVRRVSVEVAGGPEGAARSARYAAIEAVAAELATPGRPVHVLLAHTADDQAETVLLRLARGSGARSLAGMPAARGVLVRPLLGLRRAELRRACVAQGIAWWDDPTNAADGPLRRADGGDPPRAAVRHRVLPALADALGADPVPALARTADLLARDADLLDALAADVLAGARASARAGAHRRAPTGAPAGSGGPGGLDADDLDVAVLAAAPAPLRLRALRSWLVAAGAPAGALGLAHVGGVDGLVTAWRGQRGVDVPGDLRVQRVAGAGEGACLRVVPRQAPVTRLGRDQRAAGQ